MEKIITLTYEIKIDTKIGDDASILATLNRHIPTAEYIHNSIPFFNVENISVTKSMKIRNK